MTRMEDLLRQVESAAATKPPADRARRLLDLIPPTAYRSAVCALAEMVFDARARLSIRDADDHIDQDLGFERPRRDRSLAPDSQAARERMARARAGKAIKKLTPGSVVHASPRIVAAKQAWSDLINTEVPIPGTNSRLQLGDMTVDQLTTVADALYDAHLQVHALAEALREHDVLTPRQLPLEVQARVLEAA